MRLNLNGVRTTGVVKTVQQLKSALAMPWQCLPRVRATTNKGVMHRINRHLHKTTCNYHNIISSQLFTIPKVFDIVALKTFEDSGQVVGYLVFDLQNPEWSL